jgi:hypothetical protein
MTECASSNSTTDGLTIREANADRADRRLPLADLYQATEAVAVTLTELLGG